MPDCRCSHPYEWHQHLHTRTYCGTCDCRVYRDPRSLLRRLAAFLSR